MGDGTARRLSPFIPDPGGEMIFVGRNHIFAVANDGKAVVVGDDRVIGIDLERLAISLDREQGIHEPESFDLAGCRAPLAADQLLAAAGGMRMMLLHLDDCRPSAMPYAPAPAAPPRPPAPPPLTPPPPPPPPP